MLRLPPSLSLCALPLFVLGPHLIPEPTTTAALAGGGGNQPPVCAIEYQGEVVTSQKISVAITPPSTAIPLSGCSSFDPDGGPVTFEWQACIGSSFSDPTACDTVLMIPTPHGSSGTRSFEYRVDGPVPITFTAGPAPTIFQPIAGDWGPDGRFYVISREGTLHALTPASVLHACFGMPLLTLGVVLRIHWHALRLAVKRVSFHPRPPPPQDFVTR